jgi:hypothetical protein
MDTNHSGTLDKHDILIFKEAEQVRREILREKLKHARRNRRRQVKLVDTGAGMGGLSTASPVMGSEADGPMNATDADAEAYNDAYGSAYTGQYGVEGLPVQLISELELSRVVPDTNATERSIQSGELGNLFGGGEDTDQGSAS